MCHFKKCSVQLSYIENTLEARILFFILSIVDECTIFSLAKTSRNSSTIGLLVVKNTKNQDSFQSFVCFLNTFKSVPADYFYSAHQSFLGSGGGLQELDEGLRALQAVHNAIEVTQGGLSCPIRQLLLLDDILGIPWKKNSYSVFFVYKGPTSKTSG